VLLGLKPAGRHRLYPIEERMGIKTYRLPESEYKQLPLDPSRCLHLKEMLSHLNALLGEHGILLGPPEVAAETAGASFANRSRRSTESISPSRTANKSIYAMVRTPRAPFISLPCAVAHRRRL
jgi:hypothetical protein